MYRKCFFKSKGGLSRKFVASGLSAVFSSGMFGSYAGAMQEEMSGTLPIKEINNSFSENDDDNFEKIKKYHNVVNNDLTNKDVKTAFELYKIRKV